MPEPQTNTPKPPPPPRPAPGERTRHNIHETPGRTTPVPGPTRQQSHNADNPIDQILGARIRTVRLFRKMSQGALGDHLGITFQQVQKYERGANRISASTLFRASMALEIDVGWFFEGLEPSLVAAAA